MPRGPREGLPLQYFQNLDPSDTAAAFTRARELKSAPQAQQDGFVKELQEKNCKLRLVDSSGKALVHGNPGYCWPYQEALFLSVMAKELRSARGREAVRDALVPQNSVTQAPRGACHVQACLASGTVLTKSPYQLIAPYREGLAVADDPVTKKRGYINTEGKFQIAPRFAGAFVFAEGLGSAAEEPGKWGAIDTTGKFVIPPQYLALSQMADGWMTFQAEDRRGIVSAKGKEISIPGNLAAVNWLGPYAIANGARDATFGVHNAEPVLLTKEGHIQPLNGVTNAFEMPTGFAAKQRGEQHFRWYDTQFKPMYEKPLKNIKLGADGVAPVLESDLWGLMGEDRRWRVAPRYSFLGSFSYGLAEFEREAGKEMGFLTPGGDEVVIPDMAAGDCYGHFLFVVHRSKLPGFYTRQGRLIELLNVPFG